MWKSVLNRDKLNQESYKNKKRLTILNMNCNPVLFARFFVTFHFTSR